MHVRLNSQSFISSFCCYVWSEMYDSRETGRHWLAAQADGRKAIVIPTDSELRLRETDLTTTRLNRSIALTYLGHTLALRPRSGIWMSCGCTTALR